MGFCKYFRQSRILDILDTIFESSSSEFESHYETLLFFAAFSILLEIFGILLLLMLLPSEKTFQK